MTKVKLEAVCADVCLPDYWGGHHQAHVQVPVYHGMTPKALKEALHGELSEGAVMGSDPLTQEGSGPEGDKWYAAAHAAVNRIAPAVKGARRLFLDIEEVSEDEDAVQDSVCAFFVFVNLED